MANLGLFIAPPTGMWEAIISAFSNVFVNYALAIIMLTLVIKIILLPLDYLNKRTTRKTTQMQAVIQPELDVINKKYEKDPAMKNQTTQELYKKHGFNMGGSCLVMFFNLALTLVVFFTLFAGLNNMAAYKITYQYEQLQSVYQASVSTSPAYANEQVALKYDEIKDSFLWIDNVWIADSPLKSSIPTFDEYKTIARVTLVDGEYKAWGDLTEEQLEVAKTEYETIMNPLREMKNGVNGYFILAVLIVGSTVLTQLISTKKLFRKKNKDANATEQVTAKTNTFMLILMPAMMGFFAISTNAVFALYLLASQVVAMVSTPLIDLVLDKMDKKKAQQAYDKDLAKKGRIVKK